jgi:NAD(P)H-dependent FMN reductase
MINILAISGSLRAASTNTSLLRAAAELVPAGVVIDLYEGLGQLPLFNPDLDVAMLPAVQTWQRAVAQAHAIVIASPEYAHGVSGVMKNGLDWLVACEEFVGKPVALLNASPRASHALAALREILRTMSASIVAQASIALPVHGSRLNWTGIAAHSEMAPALRQAIAALVREVEAPVGSMPYSSAL